MHKRQMPILSKSVINYMIPPQSFTLYLRMIVRSNNIVDIINKNIEKYLKKIDIEPK